MRNELNTSYETISTEISSEIFIPEIVGFWIILPIYIASLICSLFILYHLLFNRTLRQALHNHVIIILLLINFIVELTDNSWILYYYHVRYVLSQTSSFCLTWQFIDEALYITTTLLFAWATIERHILIFHDRLVATRNNIILFHYLPIIIIFLYCIFYNIIVIFFPPCENTIDYSQIVCGGLLCYYHTGHVVISMWDVIFHNLISSIIIVGCSLALLLRIFCQKHRMRRPIRWRTHRKMTIQLLSISALYLVIYIPQVLMEFIHRSGVSEDFGANFTTCVDFIQRQGNLLLPFVCAGSMPELGTKVRKLFPWWKRHMRIIQPETLRNTSRRNVPRFRTTVFT